MIVKVDNGLDVHKGLLDDFWSNWMLDIFFSFKICISAWGVFSFCDEIFFAYFFYIILTGLYNTNPYNLHPSANMSWNKENESQKYSIYKKRECLWKFLSNFFLNGLIPKEIFHEIYLFSTEQKKTTEDPKDEPTLQKIKKTLSLRTLKMTLSLKTLKKSTVIKDPEITWLFSK